MAGLAIILAVVTVGGLITPWLLLALTFAISAGDAFEAPTWRALLPELVDKEDLEAASALNGTSSIWLVLLALGLEAF